MDTFNFSPAPDSTMILLVRHGVTPTTGQVLPGRAPGLHLSEKGEEQAQLVAQRLRGLELKALYSSPMERTRETAAPAALLFNLDPLIDSGLVECDFGEWTGAQLKELSALPEWKSVQETPSTFRFPGGESFVEMQKRMVSALRRIAARHPGEVVACFSHADPIKCAVAELSGTELDAFQKIQIDPASISLAEFHRDGRTEILLRNSNAGALRRQ
ncbi:Phosphoserine phosphatase 1 [Corynebacterium occultum]|uniref:Phosphoserine phosphatase 1 n=1 Tax=Corynebacterium occultum TaxID=2675219 RepID=A0A6B8VV01_9CORY|nr:histidine phosphatase family protein [Corynebacterium occultum]QGU06919.1 Phosphoserine phosphatase 1 [Corynebacterium occultum]